MRSDVVRLYKVVHTWTGITAGMLLFIAFYAGAITVFAEPLARWISTPGVTRLTPLEQSDELLARVLAARPDAGKDLTLYLGEAEDVPARLIWKKSRNDKAPWSAELSPEGELRMEQLHPAGVAEFVDRIHKTGGLPGDVEIGQTIMGVVAAVYVVAIISGLIIVLPSLAKDLFALRVGANLKRMWLDAHNVVGVLSLPFHIVIALTAVVFGLHDIFYGALDRVVYDGQLKSVMSAGNPFQQVGKDSHPASMLPVGALVERVRTVSPAFTPVEIRYRNAGLRDATAMVWGHEPSYMTRGNGFAVLSAATGEILNTDYLPGGRSAWTATVSTFFALHFATFGGDSMRACYFLLGLSGAFLFYSGNLLWIESRRRTERRAGGPVNQKRSTRLMGAATVGVCLGAICALSIAIVAGKWLNGRATNPEAWHESVFYAVFLACVAWSFIRGAAAAGVELLRLAAVSTAAIPLTTLAAWATTWALPSLGMRPSASLAALGVDLVALCGAFGFALMARAAARRSEEGPADSVWAAPHRAPTHAAAHAAALDSQTAAPLINASLSDEVGGNR